MRLAPPEHLEARLARLRSALSGRSLSALIVSHRPNIFYMSNFAASAGLLVVTAPRLYLLADFRYSAAIDSLAAGGWLPTGVEAVRVDGTYEEALARLLESQLAGQQVGFESAHLTVKEHLWLGRRLEAAVDLVAVEGMVEAGRVRKDAFELDVLREAGRRISAVARAALAEVVRPGLTEAQMAADIDHRMRRAGFERPAFETIVATGPNAALPHARPGDRRAADGDLVVVDFGGMFDGYAVDLTRTVVVGEASLEARRLYHAVAAAQDAALAAVRAGVASDAVDAAARDTLGGFGLADAFGHGTGHGLGLEVHEEPRVGKRRSEGPAPAVLEAGMVCTVEPGAYLPGFGGVRIEDDVIVTQDGYELITDVPRDARLLTSS